MFSEQERYHGISGMILDECIRNMIVNFLDVFIPVSFIHIYDETRMLW